MVEDPVTGADPVVVGGFEFTVADVIAEELDDVREGRARRLS
jgi:hypothetical protein